MNLTLMNMSRNAQCKGIKKVPKAQILRQNMVQSFLQSILWYFFWDISVFTFLDLSRKLNLGLITKKDKKIKKLFTIDRIQVSKLQLAGVTQLL